LPLTRSFASTDLSDLVRLSLSDQSINILHFAAWEMAGRVIDHCRLVSIGDGWIASVTLE